MPHVPLARIATPARLARATRPLLASGLALALATTGCAYANKTRNDDRQPVIQTGVRATIFYPNQTGPTMHPGAPYPGGSPAQGQAPGPGAPQPAPGAPAAGEITMIGGNDADITSQRSVKHEPILVKVLMAPFALVAAPFVAIANALRGSGEPPESSRNTTPDAPPSYSDLQSARDDAEQAAMERELANRPGGAPAPSNPPPQAAPPRAAPAPRASSARATTSIADELAALRGTPAPQAATAPRAQLPAPPRGVADQVSDRDRDGRPDQWSYREAGRPLRDLFDENGDGAPDRTVHFVPETGERARIEEDTDFDGRIDTWTEFRDGQVSRRRSDADRDGVLDTWSFHRRGRLLRQEHDGNGDGFRDRIDHYTQGRLARRDEDADGDGRPDRVTIYDAEERVQQIDEDRDGDGLVDQRSFYEAGRLTRRELVSADDAEAIERRHLVTTSWDDGEASEDSH